MYILGISAFYHDSASSILKDGEIIAAAQEERFTRKKHDNSFPTSSINYCLEEAEIKLNEVDFIVFYEKPFLKFERLLETYLAFAPRGFKSFTASLPIWVKEKLFQKNNIINLLEETFGKVDLIEKKLLFSEHHLSHAASAFYPSPFESSAILTMDGVGEWTTTSLAVGKKNDIKILKEIHFPHSLGLLYSAFTYYAGFKVNSGEYKLMGLAPYGKPKYVDLIKERLIEIKDDGSFAINMKYFDYCTGLTMTNNHFNKLFDGPPRKPESKITQKEMDIAASIQKVTEEIILKLAKDIRKLTNERNLCLAGGVALNCVANGILVKEKIFENVWIQPAAGDAGGSLGGALAVWHQMLCKSRQKNTIKDSMKGAYLGPKFSMSEIKHQLDDVGANYNEYSQEELLSLISLKLSEGAAVGWMQGRMEFGPRALGNRSILGDPRSPIMQKLLNLKVKFRESFRPFAPSIIREFLPEWFDIDEDSPYMLLVSDVVYEKQIPTDRSAESLFGIDKLNLERSTIPAVTHVDYSSRIQTVHKDTNPTYYSLIKSFYNLTGCPVLVNTSFNVRGEPIVCSPTDAYKCFMGTDLDVLAIENYVLLKDAQDQTQIEQYQHRYELD